MMDVAFAWVLFGFGALCFAAAAYLIFAIWSWTK